MEFTKDQKQNWIEQIQKRWKNYYVEEEICAGGPAVAYRIRRTNKNPKWDQAVLCIYNCKNADFDEILEKEIEDPEEYLAKLKDLNVHDYACVEMGDGEKVYLLRTELAEETIQLFTKEKEEEEIRERESELSSESMGKEADGQKLRLLDKLRSLIPIEERDFAGLAAFKEKLQAAMELLKSDDVEEILLGMVEYASTYGNEEETEVITESADRVWKYCVKQNEETKKAQNEKAKLLTEKDDLVKEKNQGIREKEKIIAQGNAKICEIEKQYKDKLSKLEKEIEDLKKYKASVEEQERKAKEARSLEEKRKREEAERQEAERRKEEERRKKAATTQPGAIIEFGHYPQTAGGKDSTPIKWRVLKNEGNRALVISEMGIDCKKYHGKYEEVTWADCDLRKWLNSEFKAKAFSNEEIRKVQMCTNENKDNSKYGTKGGKATEDQVFLLSIEEAEKYFKDADSRRCKATEYAVNQGAFVNTDTGRKANGFSWWWLRSPGNCSITAARVGTYGSLSANGFDVGSDGVVVRPALWLTI